MNKLHVEYDRTQRNKEVTEDWVVLSMTEKEYVVGVYTDTRSQGMPLTVELTEYADDGLKYTMEQAVATAIMLSKQPNMGNYVAVLLRTVTYA